MSASTVEVLRRARELYAEAPSHAPHPDLPKEGTLCLLMATDEAASELGCGGVERDQADGVLRQVTGCGTLVDWNAEHSTEEVLAAFDRAIECETKREDGAK